MATALPSGAVCTTIAASFRVRGASVFLGVMLFERKSEALPSKEAKTARAPLVEVTGAASGTQSETPEREPEEELSEIGTTSGAGIGQDSVSVNQAERSGSGTQRDQPLLALREIDLESQAARSESRPSHTQS